MAAKKKKAAKKPAKKVAKKPAKKAAKKAAKPKAKRKPNAAFMKPVTPNEKLAAVVGAAPLPRTELTKKLWAYIKKNGLQDKKNRRMINADDKLKAVFNGKGQVSMFDMTKLVSKNLK
jgi:upstream activation factor subunit UAF30